MDPEGRPGPAAEASEWASTEVEGPRLRDPREGLGPSEPRSPAPSPRSVSLMVPAPVLRLGSVGISTAGETRGQDDPAGGLGSRGNSPSRFRSLFPFPSSVVETNQ